MRPTQAQFEAYQQIFDYFNRKLFANSLPDCMLRFNRRGKGLDSLFNPDGWEKGKEATPEISLNVQCVREYESQEVMALIVRGMVHLWQEMYGKPSRRRYYNREWASKMEEVGLIPGDTGEAEGKQTGQSIKHYIEKGGRFERAYVELPVEYLWSFMPSGQEGGVRAEEKDKVKYTCEGCGAKVWGKSGLGIVCQCGGVVVAEGEEAKPEIRARVYRVLAAEYREQKSESGFVP